MYKDVARLLPCLPVSFFQVVPEIFLIPLPKLDPRYIPLMVSGLTAAIALDKVRHN